MQTRGGGGASFKSPWEAPSRFCCIERLQGASHRVDSPGLARQTQNSMSWALVQKGEMPIKLSPAHTLLRPPSPAAPGEPLRAAEGLCEFTGQRLSWWQAQESCDQRFGHLALGPLDQALAPHLPSSVWVGQREASLRSQPHEYGLRIWCKQGGGGG